MPRQDDLLERIQMEIEQRVAELRPLVQEHDRLQAAVRAMDDGPGTPQPPARRASSGRRGAPKRAPHGANRRAIIDLITQRPGVTRPEIAAVTGIAKPTVYSTVGALLKTGALKKETLPSGQSGYQVTREEGGSAQD